MTLRIILTDGDGIQGLAATFGAVIQTNIIQTAADAAAAAASASQAATSATNASNSAGAASASASSAATSASNASGSASAAAGSATAAGTSATNASNSASAASGSASAASTSASAAATSATNASNSASAAATSASNAAATLANALTKANNLSDVNSVATARTNLAVPGLATANVFTNDQTYQKASPTLVLSDTAQSSGNGIFRMRSITNVWNFQRNTAVAGDFSTLTTPLQVSGTDVLILSQRPTFNGATPWDSLNLSGALSGRNRIINGGFQVNQYGNAVVTGAKVYGPWDRFFANSTSATGTITVTGGTITFGGVARPSVVQTVTTTFSGTVAFSGVAQVIEGYNCKDMLGQQAVVSFIFNTNVSGTYCVALRDNGSNNSYISTFAAVANTPQKVIIPIATLPTGLNVANSNAAGLQVNIGFVDTTGTTTTSTLNSWISGNFAFASTGTNWLTTVNNFISVAELQVETGSVPTPFDRRSYGQELALCQRYQEVNGANNIWQGSATSGQSYNIGAYFRVEKRAAPSISLTNIGLGGFNTPTAGSITTSGFWLSSLCNATGNASFFHAGYVANAEL